MKEEFLYYLVLKLIHGASHIEKDSILEDNCYNLKFIQIPEVIITEEELELLTSINSDVKVLLNNKINGKT